MHIGSRLELFVDDALVESLEGAERRLHHPVPREIVMRFDRPWEGAYSGYFTILPEAGRVRLYYRGWPDLNTPEVTCCAESTDGITFTRPNLGLFAFNGSRENNIIWQGRGSHNFTPFLDANPHAPAEMRYKALASAGPGDSLVPFVSADGLHWRKLQEAPVITAGSFDSQNVAFFDTVRGEYVCFFRAFHGGPGTYEGVRWVKVCRSRDFLTWTEPEWCAYGDAPVEELYTNASIPYYRAPHLYLGFPCRFVPARQKVAEHSEPGINDGVLMSSRDGLNWQRWREAFLRPGLDPKAWTDRNNYIAWGLAPTGADEISLYWSEHYRYPTARLWRGSLRVDGFVSVYAGMEGGELLTRPLTFSGRRLVVNYATSAVGSLACALCDAEGRALRESEVLFGNETARAVSWRGGADVGDLAGRPVRLRVRLEDADLYSFRFTD